MWVAKIIIPNKEGMLLSNRTKRNNISFYGYPLSNFEKNKKFYLLMVGLMVGKPENKKNFIKDMKKDKRTIKVEMIDDQTGFWLMEQNAANKMFYDPMIIYAKPAIVNELGEYLFELASFDREILNVIAQKIRTPLYGGKLLSLKQSKIQSPAMLSLTPNLTEKQRFAFNLAIIHGYYGYPRKINLKQLAKMMKVSHSTYEFHLRIAEKKMMPAFYQNIVNTR